MKIKDNYTGRVFKYGNNQHDSLAITQDGKHLYYYNLQNGDSSEFGSYSFVMDDDKIPSESETPDAMYCCCYFNIGGFGSCENQIIADGVREFAEWLSNTEYVTSQGHFILPLRGCFSVDEVVNEFFEQLKDKNMTEMQENNDCRGSCANCGNTECEWYDDFLDDEE